MTAILGAAMTRAADAYLWLVARGAPAATAAEVARHYYADAPVVGVRPEVAVAQMAHETGNLCFGGVLTAEWHNPCGLKTADGGGDTDPQAHQRFESWQAGVRAHLCHLAVYAGAPVDSLPAVWVAPRTWRVASWVDWRDDTGALDGWATPRAGRTYGQLVADLAADFISSVPQEDTVRFVPRQEWGARPPRSVVRMSGSQGVVIHYVGPETGSSASTVRSIQAYHMDQRGYQDIAYNWLVSPDGTVYEGRGWGAQGGHTLGHNSTWHGVCCLVGGTQQMGHAGLAAVKALVVDHARRFGPDVAACHRDMPNNSTDCPGPVLSTWVRAGMPLDISVPPLPETGGLTVEQLEAIFKAMRETEERIKAHVSAVERTLVGHIDKRADQLTQEVRFPNRP